ncbi:MAG TPA: UDP-galactopyranose mutase [Ferruginibacter sp.]|nr:UDP-galactopyranose mutase [Ferruginibacter sp.]HMP19451.1 UDP-galactopyranose mutase [Ferruginibacter sp.]
MTYRFLIVGAGFSGSVLAEQLLQQLDCTIDIWDERNHTGGNCHTERDAPTGVMVHQYGPHIFNTDKKEIWDYVNHFGVFRPYVHRVKAVSKGKVYPLPVNLHTINQFFNKSFSPAAARAFLHTLADSSITAPQNFEEQALRFIGRELYEAFFYGYTKKQWGVEPARLPASILQRIPVRFSYDDNYHNNIYTGIPEDGYTAIMQQMTADKRIRITLNKKFIPGTDGMEYDHVFFTGPIDAYFNYQYGRLGYRTVSFEKGYADGDYQGTAQMNYCDAEIPHTRITEHKHFAYWEQHDKTVYFTEYSKETGPSDTPYYPKRLATDKAMLQQYRHLAEQQQKISFLGRLATYRYMDMHHVIGEALSFSKRFTEALRTGAALPVFPNEETA